MAAKTMKTFLITLWALAVCALVIIAVVLLREFLSGNGEITSGQTWHQNQQSELTFDATLLFGSTDGRGLTREHRKVRQRGTLLDQIREVTDALIFGPHGVLVRTIPAETKVNSIYLLGDDTLVLDFSRELQTLHTGGTTGEILTVYSIVNTMSMNFNEVERVQILIDGDEVETLAGHLDLEQPFTRDSRWISKPSALPETPSS
jgi:spore germination protein GerM